MSGFKDTIDDSSIGAVQEGDRKKIISNSVVLRKLFYDLIKKGCVKTIENMLIKLGPDVNFKFENGYMPLHVATLNKQAEVANLLISYEADVNAQDGNGDTPIFHATNNGDLKMITLLLINGADVKDYPQLLNKAVQKQDIKIVEILLEHGVDVDGKDIFGRTALLSTALDKNLQGNSFDIKNVDQDSVRAEIVKLLVSWGANVNVQTLSGCTALESAVKNGYVKVVEALLECKADVNPASLYESARSGITVICKILLNKGADVNAKQDDGKTALHIATFEGHTDVVELLLRAGASVNAKTDMHMTPLHFTADVHSIQSPFPTSITNVLLKFGAEIDCRDVFGRTALFIAAQNGHTEIVIELLNYGADINIGNNECLTPLHSVGIEFSTNTLSVSYGHGDFYDYFCVDPKGTYVCEVIIKILKRHVIKLKTANLYASQENFEYIISSDEINNFQEECEKELAYIKSQKIDNTNVSYYNILTKNINQLSLISRNEDIMQVFRSGDLKIKFPNYGSMIENNIRKGNIRKELEEQSNKFFHILVNGNPRLPYTCVENIFCYLNDKDLRIFIEACTPTNSNSSNNI